MSAYDILRDPAARSSLVSMAALVPLWATVAWSYRWRRAMRRAGGPKADPVPRAWRILNLALVGTMTAALLLALLRWFLAPDRSPAGLLRLWDNVLWLAYAAWAIKNEPRDDDDGHPKRRRVRDAWRRVAGAVRGRRTAGVPA